jgi:branched-chain amino acid transport system permease protein/neutral amino acid transport system permease protein
MNQFLLYVGLGVVTAAILALSAVALTLEYAVSRVANLAHGELLTIGAYAAYVVMHNVGSVPLAALAAAVVGGLGGVAMNLGVIERFSGRQPITVVIATLGVSLVVQNICTIIFGGANVGFTINQGAPVHLGPFQLTPADMLVTLSAIILATVLFLLLQRTKFGKSLRAVSENRELAKASGIPAQTIVTATWGIAGVIAGFAGFILAESIGTFNSALGFNYLLLTLTAAVAGGLGRPYGAMIGALVVGLILQLAGAYSDPSYEVAFAIAVLVILILVRPNGLFAPKQVSKL